MTHSVLQAVATAITTGQGTVLHSVTSRSTSPRLTVASSYGIGAIATDPGIRLLLADSTNAGSAGYSVSETEVGKVLYDLMHRYRGGASSPPALPPTSTGCSRLPMRRSSTTARWQPSTGR